jgi:haloalkane dehalogenase
MTTAPEIQVGWFVASGCRRGLDDALRAAYDAPFPDPSFQAGARAMPNLVPTTPDDAATPANRRAWQVLTELDIPALVAFSDGDPITGAMRPIFENVLPGAQGRTHPVIENAGHFLQEDAGDELAAHILEFLDSTS